MPSEPGRTTPAFPSSLFFDIPVQPSIDTPANTPSTLAPPTTTAIQPTPQPPKRWKRRLAIGGGITALVLVVAGVFGVVLDRTVLRHDLLAAEFDTSAGPFRTGEQGDYRFSLAGGAYRVEAALDPTGPGSAFAWFSRTAFNVDLAADVTAFTHAGPQTAVGIGCMDSPTENGHGYVFATGPIGDAITKPDRAGTTVLERGTRSEDWTPAGHRLRITCRPVGDGDIEVTGYIDGVAVLTAVDPNGYDTFQSALLVLYADDAGDSAQFDHVIAVVPGG